MRSRPAMPCRAVAVLCCLLLAAHARAVEYDARPMVIPYGSWETFYSALAARFSNKTNLTAGALRVSDMPTSASGLAPGDLWWDGSNVRVVLP